MESSLECSNISDFSLKISKHPPNLMRSLWPVDTRNNVPIAPFIKSPCFHNNEAVSPGSKGVISPRKKKYSVSKRKSKKQTISLEPKEPFFPQAQEVMKTVLATLTVKAKSTLSVLTNRIKRKRYLRNFNNLRAFHFDLIKDQSFNPNRSGSKGMNGGCFSIFYKISNFCVSLPFMLMLMEYSKILFKRIAHTLRSSSRHVNPNGLFKISWDLFLVVLIVLQLFKFSIEKCFFVDLEETSFEKMLLFSFYVDLFMSLNTKMFKDGKAVTDRIIIFKIMLSKKFFTDLAPCLCFSLIVFAKSETYDYLNLILLIKLFKNNKLFQRLRDFAVRTRKADALYQLIFLIIKIFCLAHLIAVFWHFVGARSKSGPESKTWLKALEIEETEWKIKYLFSVYWGLTTMLTVGYGDVTPTNNIEMLYNILAMFVGCCMFGYSMNKIGDILSQYQKKKNYLNNQMSRVNFMLRKKTLPLETQIKVKRYLEFVWKQELKEDPEHENFIMNKLSSELRNEIYFHTYVKLLKQVPVFKHFDDKTLIALARFMKKDGDYENQSIYFVLEGKLRLVTARDDKLMTVWRTFKKGDHFGEAELFTGMARSLAIVSADFTTLFKLSRSDVIQVLKKYPSEYEKFCQIKDLEIIYGNRQHFDEVCISCGFNDHAIQKCEFLRYSPSKKVLIHSHISKQNNMLKNFQRKRRPAYQTLINKLKFTNDLNEFISVYQDDEDLKELSDLYTQDEEYRSGLAHKKGMVRYQINDNERSEDIDTGMNKELIVRQKSRELTLSRWRRKSVRAVSLKKPAMEKHDENIIKRPAANIFEVVENFASENELDEPSQTSSQQESNEDLASRQKKDKISKKPPGNIIENIRDLSPFCSSPESEIQSKPGFFPLEVPTASMDVIREAVDKKKTKLHLEKISITKEENISQFNFGPSKDNSVSLDAVKVFEGYFPHNNITEIVKKQRKRKLK